MTDKELIITLRSMESRSKRAVLNAAVDRLEELVAYKETGMEPCETNEKYATIMAFNKLRLKVSLTRLCEILQAETEGRCVVLPCKPSDVTVYQLRNKKHARGVGISPRHVGSTSVWGEGRYALHHQGLDDCLDRDLGKTWFLTEEEAEAALRLQQPVEEGDEEND